MQLPFEEEYRKAYHEKIEQIFDSNFWSEGKMVREFEDRFSEYINCPSLAVSNGGAGLLAIFDYINVKDSDVIVPSNTFWATSVAAKKAGGNVVYADCNKYDLCISLDSIKRLLTPKTKAVVVVHIGGHIAFDIEEIADFCNNNNLYLVEDCAHAHGAVYMGKMAGVWGFAGAYSFYSTKTMPTGEGAMVCSKNSGFLEWLKLYRNYGKHVVDGHVEYLITNGFNYRMNEFTAALGIVQLERLSVILEYKQMLADKFDKIFDNKVEFTKGMISGYYKYIVFDYELKEQTGQVFGPLDLGHHIEKVNQVLPNAEWIAEHHKCVPIYYGWNKSEWPLDKLREALI